MVSQKGNIIPSLQQRRVRLIECVCDLCEDPRTDLGLVLLDLLVITAMFFLTLLQALWVLAFVLLGCVRSLLRVS